MATIAEPITRFTEADWKDFDHIGSGTLAGKYLRTFWQPIYRSEDLPVGRAFPIKILNQDFTLYRGESGSAYLVDFRCAHRLTQLSTGWVEGENIRCHFHGWMYDGTGQCVEQPVEPEPFCDQVRIKGYPVEEYLGYIFAYLGEDPAPPLPRFPQFETADAVVEALPPEYCSSNYFRRIELVADEAHLFFAHRGNFVQYDKLPRPDIEAAETEYGVQETGRRPNGTLHRLHLIMPNIMFTPNGARYREELATRDRLVWKVPIDDTSYWDIGVLAVHIKPEAREAYLAKSRQMEEAKAKARVKTPEIVAAILAGKMRAQDIEDRADITHIEDDLVLAGQGAMEDRTHETLGRTDVGILLIRQVYERELRALAEGLPTTPWSGWERIRAEGVDHGDRPSVMDAK
ncbi:MAG TPA: Rieske 2Fe-2S domain-containing protein [Chloroflexota bacterium]|jgi:5,5'-dehydrodivanillate O-demethylase